MVQPLILLMLKTGSRCRQTSGELTVLLNSGEPCYLFVSEFHIGLVFFFGPINKAWGYGTTHLEVCDMRLQTRQLIQ